MTWVRIDDTFPDHPKVVGLTDAAFRTYVRGLCYASQFLTDGFIPTSVVARDRRAVDELIAAHLWMPTGDDDGYRIHDYLEWQSSRQEVEERRKQRSKAGRLGAAKRWGRAKQEP